MAWLVIATAVALGAARTAADELPADWFANAGVALARGDCIAAVDLMEQAAAAGERRGLYPAQSFFLYS